MINFENCDKFIFHANNEWGIPEIRPESIDIRHIEWIPFNYAMSFKRTEGKGVHFYLDDYQFQRVWNRADDYIKILQRFEAVCSPDFSQFTDTPPALRLYNHYRKHWLAAYWQMHGIHVIPTICWSDADSFGWCFDGEPTNSIISISSVGTQADAESRELFEKGCREAIERLKPKEILWHGKCPQEFDWNITRIEPHYEQIVRRRKNGRQR